MKQAMRVTEIKLEGERDYDAPGYPMFDIVKVTALPVGEDYKAGIYLACAILTVPRYQPNPYHLGQSLVVTIDEGAVTTAPPMPAPIDLDTMAAKADPGLPVDPYEVRDEVVGLGQGVADRAAQDLMPSEVR
jgi:hypothetical protein